jgi:hypothetical protein
MARSIVTVVTPAESYSLVTLEQAKLYLGITTDTDDEFLEMAIARASAMVSSYCGRVFPAEEVSELFPTQIGSDLYLSRYPIVSLASATGGSAYDIDYQRGALIGGGPWAEGTVVEYTGGYEVIPLELQAATVELVKTLQFNRTRDPTLRSENILSGLYAYTLFDSSQGAGTAQQVSHILDAFRVPTIA